VLMCCVVVAGVVCCVGLSEQMFTEVFVSDDETRQCSLACNSLGTHWYAGDANGYVLSLDPRTAPATADLHLCHTERRKVGCVMVNPSDDMSLVSSSNDRSVAVWDVRSWKSESSLPLSFS
jgi:hypothetical protein